MRNTMVFQQVSENYHKLSMAEKEVIDYLIKYEAVEKLKIKMIEKELFISSTTVVRACKKLGYSTFNAFKYALVNSRASSDYQVTKTSYDKILQIHNVEITRTLQLLEEHKMQRAAAMLLAARKVFCIASGLSEIVARSFSHKLKLIDILVHEHMGESSLETIKMHVTAEDVILVFSLNGRDTALNQSLINIKAQGTKVITITNLPARSLTNLSDLALFVYTHKYQDAKLHSNSSLYIAAEIIFEMLVMYQSKQKQAISRQ